MTAAPDDAVPDPRRIIAELRRELDQAHAELGARNTAYSERIAFQAATNDVLKVMSASPGNPQSVFDLISVRARDLCDAYGVTVYEFDGSLLHWRAATGVSDDLAVREAAKTAYPSPPSRHLLPNRAILERAIVHVRDHDADAELHRISLTVKSSVVVPLMRGGMPIGALHMGSRERGGFSDAQVQLLETFADQAVIAIENAHLFNETQEALERQTATAEVLNVINSSPGNLAPVFETILEKAHSLCGVSQGSLLLYDGEKFRAVAVHGIAEAFASRLRQGFVPGPNHPSRQLLKGARFAQVPDCAEINDPVFRAAVELADIRTVLFIPLCKEGSLVGQIAAARREVRPFTEKEVSLLENFAAQAVIAIENARLLNETAETLERQTATADILKVIASSPADVQPVFEAIANSANRLLDGFSTAVFRFIDDASHLAAFTPINPAADQALKASFPRPIAGFAAQELVHEGKTVQITDTEEAPRARNLARALGFRSMVFVPLICDGTPIGYISVTRVETGSFSEHHVQLLQAFADQAVIAIENTRLFNETKEALARQTATSEVLKVIASSPSNLQPVFDAIAERSNELISGHSTSVFRFFGDIAEFAASTSIGEEADAVLRAAFPRPISTMPRFELIMRGEIAETADTEADDEPEISKNVARARGFRSRLLVPLKGDSGVIGAISVTRKHPGAFAEKDKELLQTFADQAVIAIQNVELFEEVQARTRDLQESLRQQTATADVLKVISSSPGELGPVFQALLENAVSLCDAEFGMLFLPDEDDFRAVGRWNLPLAYSEFLGKNTIRSDPKIPLSRAVMTKQPVQVADILLDQSYIARHPGIVAVADDGGARTLLQVPMLKENELVGTIGIYRQEVRPFTDKQITLVQNFAAQAVIAIENASLLSKLRQRTEDLTKSLEDLRTAQERLIQTEKLASLGQLTAGIAHEIKNPLNFVNNFSALSVELTDELNELLAQAELAAKLRQEVGELTALLRDNLSKVVQHGKRADSIVKNMLLHSREGSREQRPADINALVEESLNLAYHGARAEKAGFEITLQRELDTNAGMVEVFPQEVSRALLNLISNGFYAATKRKNENGEAGIEPTVLATTKNLGSSVEIRIRDNGTGIPPEVRDKIFNPFFTTKPTGEGTGLGLSMTHDIIVKQHGGRIDVDTKVGEFTEFIITLPRNNRMPAG